jgi:hypothetical protein
MCEELKRKNREHLPPKVAGCMSCTSVGAAERDTSFEAPACGLHVASSPDQVGKSLSAWSPAPISCTTERESVSYLPCDLVLRIPR